MAVSSAFAAWVVAFSRAATRAAISSRLVSSTYASTPRRVLISLALQWIDTKRSAPNAFARAVRSSSETKWSSSRVSTTSIPWPPEDRGDALRHVERDLLLLQAARTDRAGVLAAVAGVEHQARRPRAGAARDARGMVRDVDDDSIGIVHREGAPPRAAVDVERDARAGAGRLRAARAPRSPARRDARRVAEVDAVEIEEGARAAAVPARGSSPMR